MFKFFSSCLGCREKNNPIQNIDTQPPIVKAKSNNKTPEYATYTINLPPLPQPVQAQPLNKSKQAYTKNEKENYPMPSKNTLSELKRECETLGEVNFELSNSSHKKIYNSDVGYVFPILELKVKSNKSYTKRQSKKITRSTLSSKRSKFKCKHANEGKKLLGKQLSIEEIYSFKYPFLKEYGIEFIMNGEYNEKSGKLYKDTRDNIANLMEISYGCIYEKYINQFLEEEQDRIDADIEKIAEYIKKEKYNSTENINFKREAYKIFFDMVKGNKKSEIDMKLSSMLSELKEKLDGIIKKEKQEIIYSDFALSAFPDERAIQEMKDWSNSKSDKFRGYFYANKASSGLSHIDTYIIGQKGCLINPMFFHDFHVPSSNDIFEANLKKIILNSDQIIQAQTGGKECASLGLVYLKKYLKNDAEILKNETLLVTGGDASSGNDYKIHIPSPEVLKYSQSSLYNELFYAAVTGNNVVDGEEKEKAKGGIAEVVYKGKVYQVRTLESILEEGGDIKCPGSSKSLNKEELLEFSKKWSEKYKIAMEARDEMKAQDGSNLYLKYKSENFKVKADYNLGVNSNNLADHDDVLDFNLKPPKKAAQINAGNDKVSPLSIERALEEVKMYREKYKIELTVSGDFNKNKSIVPLSHKMAKEKVFFKLLPSEAREEMKAIVSLAKMKWGYLYARMPSNEFPDFETYIVLSEDVIINPIYSHKKGVPSNDIFMTDLSHFILNWNEPILAQGNDLECGSLGLSCLEEYLKDDAKILKETLLVTYYDRLGNKYNSHIPSPKVLKFSKSALYNKLFYAIVTGENIGGGKDNTKAKNGIAKVVHEGMTYKVRTLENILGDGGVIKNPYGFSLQSERNFPEFSKKWGEEYKIAMEAQDRMHSQI